MGKNGIKRGEQHIFFKGPLVKKQKYTIFNNKTHILLTLLYSISFLRS